MSALIIFCAEQTSRKLTDKQWNCVKTKNTIRMDGVLLAIIQQAVFQFSLIRQYYLRMLSINSVKSLTCLGDKPSALITVCLVPDSRPNR